MTMRLIQTEQGTKAIVKVYLDRDVNEFVVKECDANGKAKSEKYWYFTSDRDDAIATARSIANVFAKPQSAVSRVNQALKKAGRDERLVRGRGYYYLHRGEAAIFPSTMICCYSLDANDADFIYAAREVNALFVAADLAAPIVDRLLNAKEQA